MYPHTPVPICAPPPKGVAEPRGQLVHPPTLVLPRLDQLVAEQFLQRRKIQFEGAKGNSTGDRLS